MNTKKIEAMEKIPQLKKNLDLEFIEKKIFLKKKILQIKNIVNKIKKEAQKNKRMDKK